jgi:hypothetical protein
MMANVSVIDYALDTYEATSYTKGNYNYLIQA